MVIVYKGNKSQTGIAANKRFQGVSFDEDSREFEEIRDILCKQTDLAILPIWNSHCGEIQISHALELIFENNIKLHEVWPDRIRFECRLKNGRNCEGMNICSAFPAEHQCSRFIEEKKAKFIGFPSTKDAYDKFKNDEKIDAVLIPPNTYNNGDIKITEDASNPINFTTFVLFGNVEKQDFPNKELASLCFPECNNIFGIEMSTPYTTLSDEQIELFDKLVEEANSIDEIPKIIFVFEKEGGRCGLLLESSQPCNLSILLEEEGISQEVKIKNNLGKTSRVYGGEVSTLAKVEFPDLLKYDFIKHQGAQSCFYACPCLNVYTHGYDPEVVEPLFKKVINRYFKLFITETADCSDAQKNFFNKYKQEYTDKLEDFITFTQL